MLEPLFTPTPVPESKAAIAAWGALWNSDPKSEDDGAESMGYAWEAARAVLGGNPEDSDDMNSEAWEAFLEAVDVLPGWTKRGYEHSNESR